ncbi:anthranilate synthase component I family protein [Candidatus Peregrinibacteria bacterium]|jgi:para-aminobenzoate synthetase component I|nr:anthranilate synthase component I family protein [Candidatus Peregrinibacteria bacterium]
MDILKYFEQLPSPKHLLYSGKGGRYSIFSTGIKKELILDEKENDILKKLHKFWEENGQESILKEKTLPFQGGIFVFLSYELIENFEGIRPKNTYPQIPKIYAIVPENIYVYDHQQDKLYSSKKDGHLSHSGLSKISMQDSRNLFPAITRYGKTPNIEDSRQAGETILSRMYKWIPDTSKKEYITNIQYIKEEIKKGNTFQTNLSQRFTKTQKQSSFQIFKNLCNINPSPFSAYFESPFGEIISGSPERLVKLKNGILETKPIAGTRKRGEEKSEDKSLESELLINEKELAEHRMIVDLERNDMGRVCNFGSVKVYETGKIEKYSHVQHLVSTITGLLDKKKNFCDVIRAMHPGGTITGCPKKETCRIINTLEAYDRGIYTGSIGYINSKGDMDLNILIRSIYAYNKILYTQAGGGIVHDSDPEKEYAETLHKANAQFCAGI